MAGSGNANAERSVAAGAAQNAGAAARESNHRIIAGTNDGPIVHQEMVGDVFEADERLRYCRWRWARRCGCRWWRSTETGTPPSAGDAAVSTGSMTPRYGEQCATFHAMSVPVLGRSSTIGAACDSSSSTSAGEISQYLARHFERRHHERERLLLAMLAFAEAGDGFRVARIHQKLESSDALECDDFSLAQRLDRVFDRAIELRAAHGAGVRLSMKAAVGGVLVLLAASGDTTQTRASSYWVGRKGYRRRSCSGGRSWCSW